MERHTPYVPLQRPNQEFHRPKEVLTLDSLSSTPQEILATEHQLHLPQPAPLVGVPSKENLNRYCDYHNEKGHNTNDYFHLKRQLKIALESGKLDHLIKDVRHRGKGRQQKAKVINMVQCHSFDWKRKTIMTDEGWMNVPIIFSPVPARDLSEEALVVEAEVEGYLVQRIHIDEGALVEIMFKHCFNMLHPSIQSRLVETQTTVSGFSREQVKPLGKIELDVCFGGSGRCRRAIMKFTVIPAPSPYNIILGHPGLKQLRAGKKQAVESSENVRTQDNIIPKEQVQMADEDEEKTAFYTDQGTYCYIKMSFGLKNARATYQQLVDEAFQSQIGKNLKKNQHEAKPKKCSFGVTKGKFLGYMVTSEGIRANPVKTKDIAEMQSPRTWGEMQSVAGKLAALNRFLSRRGRKHFPRAQEDGLRPTGLNNPFAKKKTLFLYLAASQEAVSAVLLVVRRGRQHPVHYVSRTLHDAERNYAPLEKMALALRHVSRRLRRYFEAHPITVITYQPIKQVLNKADTSGRLAPYSVELVAYNITYKPRSAIKGHILTDFINEVPMGSEAMVPQQTQYTVDHDKDRKEECVLYTDGAASAKVSGAGLVLIIPTKTEYTYALRLNFESTNNQAEYEALLADALSKLASVAFNHLTKEILVETLDVPSMDVEELNAVVEEEGETWMTPIVNCLERGIWPEDQNEARTLRMKINQYVMEEGVLFKRSYLMHMLRRVGPLQANYVIREIHMVSHPAKAESQGMINRHHHNTRRQNREN
ncbi:reverse transcriptase domain-containing protein [Tanacetum coccineum]